eukprot:757225-Lingulodinium_polyedra.AAC.1
MFASVAARVFHVVAAPMAASSCSGAERASLAMPAKKRCVNAGAFAKQFHRVQQNFVEARDGKHC